MAGFRLAGGALPAVGMAILLRYMNAKNHIAYLLIGFGLAAYLKMPMLGIAIFGAALALINYKNQQNQTVVSTQVPSVKSNTLGDDEDEL